MNNRTKLIELGVYKPNGQGAATHDKVIAWAAIGFLVTLVIGLSVNVNAQSSQQSGTACVNGSQYCENNSLDTVNTTTTTNTNTNYQYQSKYEYKHQYKF